MEQADELFQAALKLSQETYGEEHPFVLKVTNSYLELATLQNNSTTKNMIVEMAANIRRKWNIKRADG